MRVRLWGTRGSLGAAGTGTLVYGGDTSAVEVRANDGSVLVLDAGSGARPLGQAIADAPRVDVLLSHLHMDHIQGLGFFGPLFAESTVVHIWGPASTSASLFELLTRYLSPPLFPVRLRDLPNVHVHDLWPGVLNLGAFTVTADPICHPGMTYGYRIEADGAVLAYLPDHEPALGMENFPGDPEWTSGLALAKGADLLIHDAQYTAEEYPTHIGWGHSAMEHTLAFARMAGVRHLCTFHHDPGRSDGELGMMAGLIRLRHDLPFAFTPGTTGETFDLPNDVDPPARHWPGRQELL